MSRLATTEEYLSALFRDSGIVELRHESHDRWTTGWFDDPKVLLGAARDRARIGNLFTSLNAPKLRAVNNQMGRGNALQDCEVGFVTRIPFDFDPVRPTGVCSTEGELEHAFTRRDRVVSYLSKLGWPLPLRAKSGNGYHAQYRTHLRNDESNREMLRALYVGLHSEFNDDLISFDRTVRNPGRIIRLYGSVNRKGPDMPDRPHRRSTVWIPPRWQQVSARQIERLANYYANAQATFYPAAKSGKRSATATVGDGDYSTLDVVAWFQSHGTYKRPLHDGKHAVRCPWSAEHSIPDRSQGSDTIVFEADGGWPGFYCSHAHCEGRTIRDVLDLWGDQDRFCGAEFRGKEATC